MRPLETLVFSFQVISFVYMLVVMGACDVLNSGYSYDSHILFYLLPTNTVNRIALEFSEL